MITYDRGRFYHRSDSGEVYVVTWIRSKVMEDMVQIWCEAMEIMNTK
jgi:hypothetical protein